MKICGIYKITSPSKKVYIGQSVDISKRWGIYYGMHCKGQVSLYNSFKKHGVENHKFEILCQCGKEELNNLEVYYIELYQCFNSKFGLNLREGGNNASLSLETRKKISVSISGNKNHFFGKKHTEETLSKMREYQSNRPDEVRKKIGDKHRGKTMSSEARKKISIGTKGEKNGMYGRTHSEKTKQFLREINLNPSKEKRDLLKLAHKHESKIVLQIERKSGLVLNEFSSIKEASRNLGIDASQIGQCCNKVKGYSSAGGFNWCFK